ncbi:probable LRR receptor-like serine/threonine-protein kinase At3g47570 [Andrographis paniculata]|uniref:probable LRR receptor-like serine/threonine-protein kinase At3g47570 n=1 Tax=Andrographis paniculata TaxID=175694 RepID=UPI0021E967C4|nr:probable LRR receptor-like serine/threonine-protein kinase At3g47570 [Andrographis paniculata]
MMYRSAMEGNFMLHFSITKTALFFFLFFYCFTAPVRSDDAQALLAFKAAIISDQMGSLTSWNETVHHCTWKGVACSPRHRDKVVSINLRSQGLVGTLPPHLGNLTFLRAIILQNNTFQGQIPDEIGRLRRLEYIEFSNNSFTGEIPGNLSECRNVYYLNLIGNSLTGRIRPELASLVRLQAFGLSKNRLSGTIPSWIGNLTFLGRLSMAECGLEGQIPESFGRLRYLKLLQLSQNRLTGSIPPGIFNSSILEISLRSNRLEGTIPPDIGYTLTDIRNLNLGENNLSGEIPGSLSNASSSSLSAINLSSNKFSGPMLKSFERLSNLEYLFFSANKLYGDFEFISSLTNCTKLKVLAVSVNLLNGTLPDSIANLSRQLTYLSLAGNGMYGGIPSGIENLVNLNFVSLRNNSLSGTIPSSIGNLVKLQTLYLEVNKLTGDIPHSLGSLSLMNDLFLGYNNFSGAIPQSFSNFRDLMRLDLSHNNLNGEIPPALLNLSSGFISFSLASNELTGHIPSEVGVLRNLGNLDLSNNRLSGPIPSALSSCVALQRLHLEGNSFGGEIPSGLRALRGLEDLDLSRNRFSGPIPSFLGEIPLLKLNLSFNEFKGRLPTTGVFQNTSAISVQGNDALCGGIVELRLQPCSTSNPNKRNVAKVLKIVLPVGVMSSILMVLLGLFIHKVKVQRRSKPLMPSLDGKIMRLSYADLVKATDGFSKANLIGSGRFGSVYKGKLAGGETMVAVKVLDLNVRGASKTFVAECNALRGTRHRNLVKILSVCLSTDLRGQDFMGLVYEFKSNGSLEEWLHPAPDEQDTAARSLNMIQRLNIAIDIASALEYLHFGNDTTIIHGDLKPSNILLDDNMVANVGDFGLAKVISKITEEFPAVMSESGSMGIKGTIGYIAPEYGLGDMVSIQGDVYSFGILLLEMFTNIRPTNEAFNERSNLHTFVCNALPDDTMDILDPFIAQEIINSQKAEKSMVSILKIGVACSNELPRDRMAMTDVVTELSKIRSAYVADERMS